MSHWQQLMIVTSLAALAGSATATDLRTECVAKCGAEKAARDDACIRQNELMRRPDTRQWCNDMTSERYTVCLGACPLPAKPAAPPPSDARTRASGAAKPERDAIRELPTEPQRERLLPYQP